MDTLSPGDRRRTMQRIRSRRTRWEDEISRELWRRGCRFRRNVRTLYGTPDFVNRRRRVVVFLDSCFWHGCPEHYNVPQQNADYWAEKLYRNRARDEAVTRFYVDQHWTIIRVWTHDVKYDKDEVIRRISSALRGNDVPREP